jgi:hypothetical protein
MGTLLPMRNQTHLTLEPTVELDTGLAESAAFQIKRFRGRAIERLGQPFF